MRIWAGIVAGAFGAALLTGCVPLLPEAPRAPTFPGYTGGLSVASGSACKRVLISGDSLAQEAGGALQAVIAGSGRCSTVINAAVPGSSLGDWLSGSTLDLSVAIKRYHPDLVVMEHVGNEGKKGPFDADPQYQANAPSDAVALSNVAKRRRVPMYWVVPPVAAYYCDLTTLSAARILKWKDWIAANDRALTGHALVDWRRPFGGEQYSTAFTFPDGAHTVRTKDCTHLTHYGAHVASEAILIAIQGAWTSCVRAVRH